MKPRCFPFTRLFAHDLGVDLGTTSTQVCLSGEGIVVDEPSLVVVRAGPAGRVPEAQAVGHLAHIMSGRRTEPDGPVCPMREGSVADIDLCAAMLREFMHKAARRRRRSKPRVLMAVPTNSTSVQLHAVLRTTLRAGARQVFLIEKPKAEALGAGLPLAEPVASMVCDVGGGSTEIAVLCMGDVAVSEWLHVGGEHMDRAVADHLRRHHSLRISDRAAETLKIEIGCARPLEPERQIEVPGSDTATGLPRKSVVTSTQLSEALREPVRAIVAAVERTMARCRPELVSELMDGGLILTGGGALLHALDQIVANATGVPVRVVEQPRTCVARGLEVCLANLDVWHNLIRIHQAA